MSASRRSLLILLAGLLGVVAVDLVLRVTAEDPADASYAERLLTTPAEDGVWIVGNSIFKTGVEPALLSELTGEPVAFEYHGGHYTSLWYLITRNALPELTEQPDLVIWGFRPFYAELPAFRQNTPNSTELFVSEGDRTYDELATGVEGPSNPLDEVAARLRERFDSTGLAAPRDDATTELTETAVEAAVSAMEAADLDVADLLREEVVEGDRSLLDVINRLVTGGEVELAEERVVDGVGDFIEGEPAEFEDGFAPLIARQVERSGARQLAVIWRPRRKADGEPTPEEERFVADAVAWFEAEGIPYYNTYDDERITPELFAEGDHFNPEGRDTVTRLLAEQLRELDLLD